MEELAKVNRDDAAAFSARFMRSKKEYDLGTLAEADWQLVKNKTNQSILNCLSEFNIENLENS